MRPKQSSCLLWGAIWVEPSCTWLGHYCNFCRAPCWVSNSFYSQCAGIFFLQGGAVEGVLVIGGCGHYEKSTSVSRSTATSPLILALVSQSTNWNSGSTSPPEAKLPSSQALFMNLKRSGYLTATTEWYVMGLTLELDGSISPTHGCRLHQLSGSYVLLECHLPWVGGWRHVAVSRQDGLKPEENLLLCLLGAGGPLL